MSSSQQPPPNSNNNQLPNQYSPFPYDALTSDYLLDESTSALNNLTFYNQSWPVNNSVYYDPNGQIYYNPVSTYLTPEEHDDRDDVIQRELEAEIDAREDLLSNEQLNNNDDYEEIYSDDVQNAFTNYENEYSKYWKQNESNWNNFSNEEQDEIFNEMQECMRFMNEEDSNVTMSQDLTESTQQSNLNPDAIEFKPSWLSSSTTTTTTTPIDKETTVVTSQDFYDAKEQK